LDILLKGGYIIDSASAKYGHFDVGITGATISHIEQGLNPERARKTIDVGGKIVTPGLIDLHTHVYHGGTSLGVRADDLAVKSGVTTFVDAGSAGAGNYAGFQEHVIDRSRVKILAFLNISFPGVCGFDIQYGECSDMKLLDIPTAVATAQEFSASIVGIKVRVGMLTSGTNAEMPLDLAKQVSDKIAKPLMSHIDRPPPTIEGVLQKLGESDILTHCFRPFPNQSVNREGLIKAAVLDARKRGVVFDTGHGRGSFCWENAQAMLEQGFEPDVISSDVHAGCICGTAKNLLHVMSKFRALGMPLEKVIEKATLAPARAINRTDIGRLSVGSTADISILREEKGVFTFLDVNNVALESDRQLVCDGILIDGVPWDV